MRTMTTVGLVWGSAPLLALLFSTSTVSGETNASVLGQLGFAAGTVLEVHARVAAIYSRPPTLLNIFRVNGKDLQPPVEADFHLSGDLPRIHFQTSDICVFRGTESVYVVTPDESQNVNAQCFPSPGKHSAFTVTEIISVGRPDAQPKDSTDKTRKKSEPHVGDAGKPAPQQ